MKTNHLPERTALTFWDSYAMGQHKEMLENSAARQQAQGERAQMDAAMTQAATDEGLHRQERAGFMRDMNTQNSAAHSTLAAQLQANIDATRRASEAHAQSIAQEIATQSRKQDQRDEVVDHLRQSLAQAHQTPASVPIPPGPQPLPRTPSCPAAVCPSVVWYRPSLGTAITRGTK